MANDIAYAVDHVSLCDASIMVRKKVSCDEVAAGELLVEIEHVVDELTVSFSDRKRIAIRARDVPPMISPRRRLQRWDSNRSPKATS